MNNNISMEALSDSVCIIDGYMYKPTSVSHRSYNNRVSFEVTLDPKRQVGTIKAPTVNIKNVIFNPPATIVFWSDNTKTVVKCHSGDEFDPEKGLTMAYFKKMHGNKYSYFNEIKHWTKKYKAPEIKPIDWSAIVTAIAKTGVDPQSIQGFGQLLGKEESPSKEVAEMGEAFGDGFAEGVATNGEYAIFATLAEAQEVLDELNSFIVKFDSASIADFHGRLGMPSFHIETKFGWRDLTDARIIHVRDGFKLQLPEAVEIE